ncbi:MAG: ABC transporter ATP-binding protein [Pirellulaceae bacterium]|jgi:ABC-2 type transport system ATP-binding protein|nr:ABC transporter ATP-binding protein [Pirellulaceae bacterium]MDP7302606.1 ABC transporter ATP-binding protein [Pirellulaceae bacterium]HJN10952.1 ABC transporter ATP-binding protein [Pirellulaceae bacterium]
MIELNSVSRNYGKKVAVDGLDLQIPAGELFAFLGPNGAGKTTSIKMMVGLLQPTQGRIEICGYDVVRDSREANLRTGYVPDEPYLYDKLTGREFLQFMAEIYGMESADGANGIEKQIDQFGLSDFIDQMAESYSHGMKQRLVFASALLHRPCVLIVDEPMVGLDPRSMRLVKDILREETRQGTTVFMSTHTLAVAEEIADRIGVITNGHLLFLGTVADLRARMSSDESLEQLFLALTEEEVGDAVGQR